MRGGGESEALKEARGVKVFLVGWREGGMKGGGGGGRNQRP